jgi:hypothetical protein
VVNFVITVFQLSCGIWNNSVWKEDYLPKIASPEKVKKLFMSDHPEGFSAPGSAQKWIEHGRILATIAKFICDPEMLKILLLLILTRVRDGLNPTEMVQLHKMYLDTIKRRIRWKCSKNSRQDDPNDILFGLNETISNIDRLVMIHVELLNQMT